MTTLSTELQAARGFGRGYIDGLITANGTDADHDIDIAAGECRDSTNTYNMILGSTLTKQIDASWASGNNAGGLFSGSVGNSTWYHVFLIRRDDGTIDAGFDTSVSAANRPAGYSTYRRIGSVLTNSSANIIAFTQNGDQFLWNSYTTDKSGAFTAGAWTAYTASVPTGVVVDAIVKFDLQATAITAEHAGISDYGFDNWRVCGRAPVLGEWCFATTATCRTNTSAQLKYYATGGNSFSLFCMGWIDPRGRDAA